MPPCRKAREPTFDREKEKEKTQMITRQRVEGEVECNDGEFAEVATTGIEGIEKNLRLDTLHIDVAVSKSSHAEAPAAGCGDARWA